MKLRITFEIEAYKDKLSSAKIIDIQAVEEPIGPSKVERKRLASTEISYASILFGSKSSVGRTFHPGDYVKVVFNGESYDKITHKNQRGRIDGLREIVNKLEPGELIEYITIPATRTVVIRKPREEDETT